MLFIDIYGQKSGFLLRSAFLVSNLLSIAIEELLFHMQTSNWMLQEGKFCFLCEELLTEYPRFAYIKHDSIEYISTKNRMCR